ncbi:unnamed protein product (macronuclear) [Paramecium tetraurelia]|uniref:Uncharacterized protein n=1 Tax=Paramecium tetraurelia TaxID=5888 RepID=A0EFU9_PARTE|nr:uncharacterized protein GSPATT00026513001 [Paramecium tetraurelia]CAK94190.1 unnamed protein product [Paramecium tetraurelia]|eukprot:XP_001461563.1 hypothetical protein (macronuclear) [Paramecium tetraurelia strain d4-2]
MVELDAKKQLAISNLALLMIEIVLLTEYSYMNEHPHRNQNLTYVRFAISGQVFMMLAFMGLVATYFFPHKYIKLGIFGSLWLGFILVFIGMIVGAKYYKDGYDTIASTWWIEVGLTILGFLNFIKAFSNEPQPNEEYQRQV